MRTRLFVLPIVFLMLSVMPTSAQDAPSPTMADTVSWINQQVYQLYQTFPEAPLVEFDPLAREPSESYCASTHDGASALVSDGCSRTGFGMGIEFDGCHRRYIRGNLSLASISGCSGSMILTTEETATESVQLFTGPTHDGDDWYCMHSHGDSGDVRLQLRIAIALSDFSRSTNVPSSGAPGRTFWIQARDYRDAFHVNSRLAASYYGRGHGQTFDVHEIALQANSDSMAERLAHAFNHIAQLCASTRPAEPF